jgi:Dolichyl-phosphate-mannose-protein mannosyltransferase
MSEAAPRDRFQSIREAIARDPGVWFLVLLLGLVYLSLAGRYDTFRNELYYIVCGRHPSFGYVDMPPLVPLVAALTQIPGNSTWLLRLPAIAAALALIPLSAAFARAVGGGRTAAWMAGLASGIAPMLVGLTATLGTSTFEPFASTLCGYLLARAAIGGERSSALWAGIVAGIAMQAKYGIALWALGLALGLAATAARRVLSWPQLWFGIAIGALIALPSLIWQAVQGWPFLAVIHFARTHRNLVGTPLGFEIHQLFAMNILLAPLWIAGVLSPFLDSRLREARFLSIAFVAATVLIFAAHGKDYYLAPAYPTMFAVGAVALASLPRWLRGVWLAGAVVLSLIAVPVVLPVLDPPTLQRYLMATRLKPRPNEVEAIGAPLTQIFSDELGWRQLEKQVAAAYWSLPVGERARTAIMTVDYGEAAAIDVYGRADGLPPALCGQLQYGLWGTHGYDGSAIIHVNGDPERWARLCTSSKTLGQFGGPYVMPYENGPIILCQGLRKPLSALWPRFKRYR